MVSLIWRHLCRVRFHSFLVFTGSLVLNKKLEIVRYKGHNLVNKRSEIVNECRHINKFALALYDSRD